MQKVPVPTGTGTFRGVQVAGSSRGRGYCRSGAAVCWAVIVEEMREASFVLE